MFATDEVEAGAILDYDKIAWPHEADQLDYACIVVVLDYGGNVAMVIDRTEDAKDGYIPKWKFPGGGMDEEGRELPPETASRVVEEETGIRLMPEVLYGASGGILLPGAHLAEKRGRTSFHYRYFFVTIVPEFENLKKFGDEGEEVEIFHLSDLSTGNPKFLEDHIRTLRRLQWEGLTAKVFDIVILNTLG